MGRLIVLAVSIAACLGIPAPAVAQCRLTAVHDAAPVSGSSMGIRVGRIDWASFPLLPRFANRVFGRTMRPRELAIEVREKQLAALEVAFTDAVLAALQRPNRTLIRDTAQSADVILYAELVDIDPGNRFWRAYSGSEWASATVLAILTAPDGRPLVSLRCDRSTGGGLWGLGGWTSLWQSGESLVRSNLKKIARSISRELDKSAEAARRLIARRPSRVDVGHLRYGTRLFLERPAEKWSFKDAASVLGTFMTQTTGNIVGSPPVLGKGVHTLWLTELAYRAIRRARDLLAGGETSMWVHPFSYEFDDELLDTATAEGAYAIAVWPFDKPPYLLERECHLSIHISQTSGTR